MAALKVLVTDAEPGHLPLESYWRLPVQPRDPAISGAPLRCPTSCGPRCPTSWPLFFRQSEVTLILILALILIFPPAGLMPQLGTQGQRHPLNAGTTPSLSWKETKTGDNLERKPVVCGSRPHRGPGQGSPQYRVLAPHTSGAGGLCHPGAECRGQSSRKTRKQEAGQAVPGPKPKPAITVSWPERRGDPRGFCDRQDGSLQGHPEGPQSLRLPLPTDSGSR